METMSETTIGRDSVRFDTIVKRPVRVRNNRYVQAHCTPPGESGIPAGIEWSYWKERDMYLCNYFEGYTSAVPGKFAMMSDAFEIIDGTEGA